MTNIQKKIERKEKKKANDLKRKQARHNKLARSTQFSTANIAA